MSATAETSTDALRWMRAGAELLTRAAHAGGTDLRGPSTLPGWTRAHVLAHVAGNAEAVGNLVRWAATGEETPMYASPQARIAAIETGAALPAAELLSWVEGSAVALATAMAALTPAQWNARVVTAQGRIVSARELPYLRAREVCVHAVDLAAGVTFADLPADFLAALCDDIVARRRGDESGPGVHITATDADRRWELPGPGSAVPVSGALHDVTAYLAGRPHRLETLRGDPAPALPPWI